MPWTPFRWQNANIIAFRAPSSIKTTPIAAYQASKKRYFYGLRIHLMVTRDDQPHPTGTRFFLTLGSFSETTGLEYFDSDLPEGAIVFGDKAYNYYFIEDILRDCGIELLSIRKKKIPRAPCRPASSICKPAIVKRLKPTGPRSSACCPIRFMPPGRRGSNAKSSTSSWQPSSAASPATSWQLGLVNNLSLLSEQVPQ